MTTIVYKAPEVFQQVIQVPIADIVPSPTNPRKSIDPTRLKELADSIKAVGIQVPLSLRRFAATYYVSRGVGGDDRSA